MQLLSTEYKKNILNFMCFLFFLLIFANSFYRNAILYPERVFIFLDVYILFYVCFVLLACMYVHCVHACYSWKPEETIGSPQTKIMYCCGENLI